MSRARALKRFLLWSIILAQFAVIGGLFYRLCTNHFRLLARGDAAADAPPEAPDDRSFP